ncbi:MAG: hypothetical protein MK130_07755 [Puniceicoccaceae bacterium]|nr:hypothetical protein [Puniceicoccaceae bacterium]
MAVSIDMKALAGIDKYRGDKTKFPQVKYTFESLIATGSEELLQLMQTAETMQATIKLISLSPGEKQASRSLGCFLSQVLGDGALTVVMNCERANGLEQWRVLVQRELPGDGASQVAQLLAMVSQKLDDKDLMNQIEELEARMARYESTFAKVLSDSLQQAILLGTLPEPIMEKL